MLRCSWKESFGIDCFFCGFQRGFYLICQGDILGSLAVFPALLPFLFVLIFTILHLFIQFKHGAKIIVAGFSVTVAIMLIHFIVKLITGSAYH